MFFTKIYQIQAKELKKHPKKMCCKKWVFFHGMFFFSLKDLLNVILI